MEQEKQKRNIVFSVRDLHLNIGDRKILHGVDIDLYEGQATGLIGLSGSGKTVFSKVCLGLNPPAFHVTAGTCGYLDKSGQHVQLSLSDPETLTPVRGDIVGYIVQNAATALNPSVRCGRQIQEVLRSRNDISPDDKKRKVIDQLADLDFRDPERIYDAYPHELSGGQQQRIVIAMAVIAQPKVVIADEPTTGLDVLTEQKVLSLLKKVTAERNIALLLISHDIAVLHEMTEALLLLDAGQIIQVGSTGSFLDSRSHPVLEEIISTYIDIQEGKTPGTGNLKIKLPVLEASGIVKTYRGRKYEVPANRNVHIALSDGEFAALVGVSGSGKSTLGLILSDLVEQDRGVIDITGALAKKDEHPGKARPVQMIFQDPYASLYPHKTLAYMLREAIAGGEPGLTREAISKRQTLLMQQVGLPEEYLKKYAHQLSGGERQRFQIARALAVRPSVLICDESLEGLDLPVQMKVLQLLDRLRKEEGLALLFITHHLGIAKRFADRILIMHEGEIVEEGSAEDVFLQPRHQFTKALVEAEKLRKVAYVGRH